MLTSARDRVGATTGALWVVLTVVGNQINVSGTDQSQHPSGASILRDVNHQAGNGTATFGFVLEVLGFVALIAFLGYLTDIWRRHNTDGTSDARALCGCRPQGRRQTRGVRRHADDRRRRTTAFVARQRGRQAAGRPTRP